MFRENNERGVKLEVNTAGYDITGIPYPLPWIVREAVEMGIELVLCSDSYKPEQVARHFDETAEYIRKAVEVTSTFSDNDLLCLYSNLHKNLTFLR